VNELLYYVQNAVQKLHKNDIITTCEEFYKSEEIETARNLLWNKYRSKGDEDRMPRRTGTSKVKTSLNDIYEWVKSIDLDGVTIKFAAVSAERVPFFQADCSDFRMVRKELGEIRSLYNNDMIFKQLKICKPTYLS